MCRSSWSCVPVCHPAGRSLPGCSSVVRSTASPASGCFTLALGGGGGAVLVGLARGLLTSCPRSASDSGVAHWARPSPGLKHGLRSSCQGAGALPLRARRLRLHIRVVPGGSVRTRLAERVRRSRRHLAAVVSFLGRRAWRRARGAVVHRPACDRQGRSYREAPLVEILLTYLGGYKTESRTDCRTCPSRPDLPLSP